jgi:hypothetical protein
MTTCLPLPGPDLPFRKRESAADEADMVKKAAIAAERSFLIMLLKALM